MLCMIILLCIQYYYYMVTVNEPQTIVTYSKYSTHYCTVMVSNGAISLQRLNVLYNILYLL